MKIIATSDHHLRTTPPINRNDKDYFETLSLKEDFIFNYAIDNNVDIILNGGDLLDQSIVSDRIKTYLLRWFSKLKEFNIQCWGVIGQHCQAMRHVVDNSSISVIFESKLYHRLGVNQPQIWDYSNNFHLYGVSYNEEIPKIHNKSKYNILVIHKMISDRDYWSSHVDYTGSKMFLTKYKFDLIISGDNHTTFTTKIGNRLLINPGSLCRARIDQIDHKPCFFVIDTDTQEYEQIFIPVKPAEEVFNLNIKEKKDNQELTKLMEALKIRKNHEFNYLKQAEEVALDRDNDVDDWTRTVMMEVINEINEKGLK